MNEPFRLDGKRALVTGGAGGIGEQICRRFHASGAEVLVADIDSNRAKALADALPGARTLQVDVASEESVAAAFRNLDRLDIVVNNAGVGLVGNVEETDAADFDRLVAINIRGVFLIARASAPLLQASRGNMIMLGSVAGLVGVKRRFAYCATKGAVVAMTRQLAVDYPHEFRVNCICPGTVETPFVEGYLRKYHAHELEDMRAQLHARQPVGRMGRPEEIASLALYLASDEAAFTHGSVITIDGGWTAA